MDLFMDNTTTPTSADPVTPAPVTPFPASNGAANAAQSAGTGDSVDADTGSGAQESAGATPAVDRLIKQAATSAHDVIDSVASKVSSLTDGLQRSVSNAGDARDEWVEAARDAIRQHPFATAAGALVVGAALVSLVSSRRD
jgi:ElaB/YqjD/DUF883 family membrane-anchored ribosome-binding protein